MFGCPSISCENQQLFPVSKFCLATHSITTVINRLVIKSARNIESTRGNLYIMHADCGFSFISKRNCCVFNQLLYHLLL